MFDHPLYQAILDDPDDDESRSVLADWLEERGDERGEFIRVQIEIARAKRENGSVKKDLIDREAELMRQNRADWTAQLCGRIAAEARLKPADAGQLVSQILYYRGFPSWIGIHADQLIRDGDTLMNAAPWQYVRLNCHNGNPGRLCDWPGLAKLRTLTITGGGDDVVDLFDSEFLGGLEKLIIILYRQNVDQWKSRIRRLRSRGRLRNLQECRIGRQSLLDDSANV